MSESPPEGESTLARQTFDEKPQVEVAELLSEGFLGAFLPEMESLQQRLQELTQNQGILIETMQQENSKFTEKQMTKNLESMLAYVGTYQHKLLRLKQEMVQTQDRVTRLKKRSLKLKAQKEKEELCKAEARERERELERQLTAKLATEYRQ